MDLENEDSSKNKTFLVMGGGDSYRVPANYDKCFSDGNKNRNPLTAFNSNNTDLLDVEQVKEKLLSLQYIRDEIAAWKGN